MSLDRPVLIAGAPRSGKTCVCKVLRRAEEFHGVEEPLMIWNAWSGRWPDDRRTAADATPRIKRRILRRCEQIIARHGKPRYLDNLSYHALRIPFIHAIVPDVRLIHVIRDPADAVPEIAFGWKRNPSLRQVVGNRRRHIELRAVPRLAWKFARNYVRSRVSGSRETYGPMVPGLHDFVRAHAPLEVAAYQWTRLTEIAAGDLQDLPDAQRLEVRFDRILADPRGEAKRIAQFAEVDNPDEMIDFAADYLRLDYVHSRVIREEHTPVQWQSVRRITGPLEEKLGYTRTVALAQAEPSVAACSGESKNE